MIPTKIVTSQERRTARGRRGGAVAHDPRGDRPWSGQLRSRKETSKTSGKASCLPVKQEPASFDQNVARHVRFWESSPANFQPRDPTRRPPAATFGGPPGWNTATRNPPETDRNDILSGES